jgi:hypothetical protein
VTSWITADGKERLYVSKKSAFDGSAPVGSCSLASPAAHHSFDADPWRHSNSMGEVWLNSRLIRN